MATPTTQQITATLLSFMSDWSSVGDICFNAAIVSALLSSTTSETSPAVFYFVSSYPVLVHGRLGPTWTVHMNNTPRFARVTHVVFSPLAPSYVTLDCLGHRQRKRRSVSSCSFPNSPTPTTYFEENPDFNMAGSSLCSTRRSESGTDQESTPLLPTKDDPLLPKDGNPLYLYVLTLCSTIGGFLFGYDTGVISGALVLLRSPEVFDLSNLQSESVVSAAVGGAIVGAALSSCGNDVLGRRRVILLSSTMFTVGSALMAFAHTFGELLIGRLVVGIAIGFASMTVPLYIAEVSPPDIRGQLVSLNNACVTGGQFFACVLDALLADVDQGWRYMLGLAAIPALVQFLGFLVLPETPRYLMSKGRKEEAWDSLIKVRGTMDVSEEFSRVEDEVERGRYEDTNVWDDLRSPAVIRALVLGCFLQALAQLCGINTVMYYGASIIEMAGFTNPTTAIWLSALVSFSNFIFTFVGIYLVERAGRRLLTLGSLAGVFFSLVALGGSFFAAEMQSTMVKGVGECSGVSTCFDCVANAACGFCSEGSPDPIFSVTNTNLCMPGNAASTVEGSCSSSNWSFQACPSDSRTPGWVIFVALFVYLAFFASGMGCMPWTINAEIYPLRVRSFALGMATSVCWVTNLLVSFTFLSIVDMLSVYGAFWLYATIALLGFAYLWKELPETKGLELEEIQQIFERREKRSSSAFSTLSIQSTRRSF